MVPFYGFINCTDLWCLMFFPNVKFVLLKGNSSSWVLFYNSTDNHFWIFLSIPSPTKSRGEKTPTRIQTIKTTRVGKQRTSTITSTSRRYLKHHRHEHTKYLTVTYDRCTEKNPSYISECIHLWHDKSIVHAHSNKHSIPDTNKLSSCITLHSQLVRE